MMSEPGATVLVTATSNGSMMSRSLKSFSRCYHLYPTHTWCVKHTQSYISQDQKCVFLEML